MNLFIDLKPKLDDWKTPDNSTIWHISTVFCDYEITTFKGKFYLEWIIPDREGEVGYSDCFDEPFNTLDEAKAAAQADYERRTAERFVRVKPISEMIDDHVGSLYQSGYNAAVKHLEEHIQIAIDGAKEKE